MSDSDDTDILLLIPPDFFVAETQLNESLKYDRCDVGRVAHPTKATPKRKSPKNILVNGRSTEMDRNANKKSPSCGSPLRKQCAVVGTRDCHRQNVNASATKETVDATKAKTPVKSSNDSYLKEIDSYLAGYSSDGQKLRDVNSILVSNGITPLAFSEKKQRCDHSSVARASKPIDSYLSEANVSRNEQIARAAGNEALARSFDGARMSDWNFALHGNREQLINMNDVWCDEPIPASADIQEEQLRRRQCERQVQNMQNQIKEYQEKISVAIKIDQTKNAELAKLHETNSK